MKAIKITMWILAALYLIILLAAYLLQDKLLFFPAKVDAAFKYQLDSTGQEVFLKTADGETINGIHYKRAGNGKVILYFHGNGGSLDSWQFVAADLLTFNTDVLMIDYRGYGKSTGNYSEKGFYEDGKAALDYLLAQGYKPEQIILYGRSLGTGVATEMALTGKATALILESPFTAITDVAKKHYPFLLPGLTLKYKFNSLAKIPDVKIPVLILHGQSDELIPYQQGQQLYNAAKAPGKRLVLIEQAGHNNVGAFAEYTEALREFLQQSD